MGDGKWDGGHAVEGPLVGWLNKKLSREKFSRRTRGKTFIIPSAGGLQILTLYAQCLNIFFFSFIEFQF